MACSPQHQTSGSRQANTPGIQAEQARQAMTALFMVLEGWFQIWFGTTPKLSGGTLATSRHAWENGSGVEMPAIGDDGRMSLVT